MLSGRPTCPISIEDIIKPVTAPCGHSFEEAEVNAHIAYHTERGKDFCCPLCGAKIPTSSLKPNLFARALMEEIEGLKKQLADQEKSIQHYLFNDEKKSDSMANTLTLFGSRLRPSTPKKNAELLAAVAAGDFTRVAKLLAKYKFNLDMRDRHDSTLLHIAINNKKYKEMNLLIANKANVNAMIPWRDIRAPLLVMVIVSDNHVEKEKYDILRKLLAADANVNAQTSKYLDTAMHWAAYISHITIIELLLEFQANPLLKNKTGRTPLSTALLSVNKDANCISLLENAERLALSRLEVKSVPGVTPGVKKPWRTCCF
jgi:ankyrin repeat protein